MQTMTKQEMKVRTKLRQVVTEAEQFELPGMPEEFERRPAPEQFRILGDPLYELAPGLWGCGTPEWEMPTHVVCKLIPCGDGKWELEPEVAPGCFLLRNLAMSRRASSPWLPLRLVWTVAP